MSWLAAATFGAGLLSGAGQRSANRQNAALAREQMAFQERMSSTAYQRAAKDLEAAGLNRILALGSPASSPGGQTAVMQNAAAPVANATQAAAIQAGQLKLLREQARKTGNEADMIEGPAAVGREAGKAANKGVNLFNKVVPERLSTGNIDYSNVWDSFKNELQNRLEAGANSAAAIRDNVRKGTSVKEFFQDRKPTKQEASQFQNVWNSLPTNWDNKRKMWHMASEYNGRWPDWAMEMLRMYYPEAREQ